MFSFLTFILYVPLSWCSFTFVYKCHVHTRTFAHIQASRRNERIWRVTHWNLIQMDNDYYSTYVRIEISWFANNYYIFIILMTKVKKITLFDVERITNPEFWNNFFYGKFRIFSVFKLRSNIFEQVLHKYPNSLWNSKSF